MAETVEVVLRDESSRTVSKEDLEDAASGLSRGIGLEPEVAIDGQDFAALSLLAAALRVNPADLRPNLSYSALEKLGLRIHWPAPDVTAPPEHEVPTSQVDEDNGSVPDLTPRLAVELQRERGKWVAIHRGELLASEPTLQSTRRMLAGRAATVLFMPLKDDIHEVDF
jgi:hypothetical protein